MEKDNIKRLKSRKIRVFVSYRDHEPSASEAELLAKELERSGYIVFHDKNRLRGGQSWANEIYRNIRESDVLIVLLQNASPQASEKGIDDSTHKSEWVQREVDVARGANVSILPISIYGQSIRIADVQMALAIRELQYEEYASPGHIAQYLEEDLKKDDPDRRLSADEREQIKKKSEEASQRGLERLIDVIENLSNKTRIDQMDWYKHLNTIRAKTRAFTRQNHHTLEIPHTNARLHLAAGDITEMRGIDVLVNSENDYMQMARIFESTTLSSSLRTAGALVQQGRLLEDRIQEELDEQVKTNHQCGLPVMIGQVLLTHAGHPESDLARRGARYILHAATMRFEALSSSDTLQPVGPEGIETVTRNCLKAVVELNKNRGQILKPESRFLQGEHPSAQPKPEAYEPVRSIVFPVFGTGHGGRSIREVLPPMLRTFYYFLREMHDDPNCTLEDIYVAIYAEADLAVGEDLMGAFVREVRGEE